jgi:hypothetical protein
MIGADADPADHTPSAVRPPHLIQKARPQRPQLLEATDVEGEEVSDIGPRRSSLSRTSMIPPMAGESSASGI